MRRFLPVLALTLALFTSRGQALPPPAEDPEEIQERKVVARRAVADNCTICHAPDLIEAQRLTPKQWQAEVEKMAGWGSPLPPDQVASVVAYLAAEYPVAAKAVAAGTLSSRAALDLIRPEPNATLPTNADRALGATRHATNCANCHGPDAQGGDLGPNLVEKPVLLRPNDFAEIVRKGRGRMPAFGNVLDPRAETDILAWLRDRRYQGRIAH